MSKKSSVIEINGQRYDAITGKLIGSVKKIGLPLSSGSIDGITRAKSYVSRAARTHVKHPAAKIHHRTQKTKTLMRRGVSPPAALKNFHKFITAAGLPGINSAKLTRAGNIHKSDRISRYSTPKAKSSKAQLHSDPGEVIMPASAIQSHGGLVLSKPLPSMVTSVSHQRLERMLDEALTRADAHKQMLDQLKKRSFWSRLGVPRWLSLSVMLIALVIASGVYAYQRIPQVSLKMAASKAKISATVPAYKPDGFSVTGPVKYQGGGVVMSYGAGGNQTYTITQKASDWDSTSLAANAIPSNTPVQTSQINGTTVYIYGNNNNAAWVSNGIKYTITDNANLSSDQIIKIANSL